MEQIFITINEQINNNFDFSFMITANILTYFVIKIIDYFNGDKSVPTYLKRLVLVLAVIALAIIYYLTGYNNNIILLNSAIAAPVFYSWIIKPALVKFNIGYKTSNK